MVLPDFVLSVNRNGQYINSVLPMLYWAYVVYSPAALPSDLAHFGWILTIVGLFITAAHVVYLNVVQSRIDEVKQDNIQANPWLLLGGMRLTLALTAVIWVYGFGTVLIMLTHMTDQYVFYLVAAYFISLTVMLLSAWFIPKYRNFIRSVIKFSR
jgi:hypothetical protein